MSEPARQLLRLAINGRFVTQTQTGVQRYAMHVVSALDRRLSHLRNLEAVLVLPKGGRFPEPLTAIAQVERGRVGGHLWDQLVLPFERADWLLSLGNVGPVLRRRQTVVVHDMSYRLVPQAYSRVFCWIYRTVHLGLRLRNVTIATPSNASWDSVVRFGLVPSGTPPTVFSNGCEHVLSWPSQRPIGPGFPDQFVLLVGRNSANKNFDLIYDLAPELFAAGISVVVAGSRAESDADQPGVHFLGRVDDATLRWLYEHALALLMPSLNEGFGMPVVEAMALGTPVICSDRGSLPEVSGQGALILSPEAAEDWRNAILHLSRDEAFCNERRRLALREAARHSWDATAARIIDSILQSSNVERRRGV